MGGRVEKSKGFSTNSFDRVLLDAPCSALGLRPRLFAGEVGHSSGNAHLIYSLFAFIFFKTIIAKTIKKRKKKPWIDYAYFSSHFWHIMLVVA